MQICEIARFGLDGLEATERPWPQPGSHQVVVQVSDE